MACRPVAHADVALESCKFAKRQGNGRAAESNAPSGRPGEPRECRYEVRFRCVVVL